MQIAFTGILAFKVSIYQGNNLLIFQIRNEYLKYEKTIYNICTVLKMFNSWSLLWFHDTGFLLVNNLFKKACFLFEIKHSSKLTNTFQWFVLIADT